MLYKTYIKWVVANMIRVRLGYTSMYFRMNAAPKKVNLISRHAVLQKSIAALELDQRRPWVAYVYRYPNDIETFKYI